MLHHLDTPHISCAALRSHSSAVSHPLTLPSLSLSVRTHIVSASGDDASLATGTKTVAGVIASLHSSSPDAAVKHLIGLRHRLMQLVHTLHRR